MMRHQGADSISKPTAAVMTNTNSTIIYQKNGKSRCGWKFHIDHYQRSSDYASALLLVCATQVYFIIAGEILKAPFVIAVKWLGSYGTTCIDIGRV
ncbi:uncharacterized protein H6S33_012758 [Morchella sextelata]|uniref:uncharacterized protein n=1 Tax=Morchella sextelata TaxID=1174677 RepID=UPI001D040F28|nr:uncharacterized protein H6S33_012758 [Morchella sextelata]KAH0609272.1 hypothetical protein H6S33_012758 [Morchella sextelata]